MRGLAALFALSICFAAASKSAADGVYTKEQAARGNRTYNETCANCHGQNLMGGEGAPALAGKDFLTSWTGRTAADLFETVMKTMPSDDPGSLSTRQCADLTAYILSANDFPAGSTELSNVPASLKDIRIEKK